MRVDQVDGLPNIHGRVIAEKQNHCHPDDGQDKPSLIEGLRNDDRAGSEEQVDGGECGAVGGVSQQCGQFTYH